MQLALPFLHIAAGDGSPMAAPAHTPRVQARRGAASGQTLVEFALVVVLFITMTLGLLDGTRVIFYYSQIQEAARVGARYGAVQVGRDDGSGSAPTFDDVGNAPGTYTNCANSSCNFTPATGFYSSQPACVTSGSKCTIPSASIVATVAHATVAVNLSQATIVIDTENSADTFIPGDRYEGNTANPITDNDFTNQPVVVTLKYPFTPILGLVFNGLTINLQGESTMLHE